MGLVSKNGILIVEFANKLQEAGWIRCARSWKRRARGCGLFLMTSVATVVGHFPLVLAGGPGAGSRNSIGYVLVTGMVVGTVFTLFVVPAIYMVVARRPPRGRARIRRGGYAG